MPTLARHLLIMLALPPPGFHPNPLPGSHQGHQPLCLNRGRQTRSPTLAEHQIHSLPPRLSALTSPLTLLFLFSPLWLLCLMPLRASLPVPEMQGFLWPQCWACFSSPGPGFPSGITSTSTAAVPAFVSCPVLSPCPHLSTRQLHLVLSNLLILNRTNAELQPAPPPDLHPLLQAPQAQLMGPAWIPAVKL